MLSVVLAMGVNTERGRLTDNNSNLSIQSMNAIFGRSFLLLSAVMMSFTTGATGPSKTVRVEHGRPIVVVSEKAVLWLEFLSDSRTAVSHPEPGVRRCQAEYCYQLFDANGSVTNGQGVVEETLKVVNRSATGQQVEDRGSRTSIYAGEFHLWWSEGTAGTRSWIYYRADSPVRFIQQPQ